MGLRAGAFWVAAALSDGLLHQQFNRQRVQDVHFMRLSGHPAGSSQAEKKAITSSSSRVRFIGGRLRQMRLP